MAGKVGYNIVGRFMDGSKVTGYYLYSLETGKSGRFSKEQVVFLVGKGQVNNCEGQIYKDEVLLRGKGINLSDLPVVNEKGEVTRTAQIGKVRRGTEATDALTQLTIVARLVKGVMVVGYVLRDAGGATKAFTRQQVYELASAGRIGNARVQMYNGKQILKGVNCDLSQLEKINYTEQ